MKNKFRLMALLIVAIMCLAFTGCEQQADVHQEVTLNERQKEILINAGLPTVYAELSEEEQFMITKSEELLQSGERAFDEPLAFYQFVPEADSGKPGVMVYKESDLRKALFYIIDSEESSIVHLSHDYPRVELQYSILDILMEHMYNQYSEDEIWGSVRANTPVTHVDLPAESITPFDAIFFINKEELSSEELQEIAADYADWLVTQEIAYPSTAYFFTVSNEEFEKLDEIYLMELVNDKDFVHGLYVKMENPENISITESN